MTNNETSNFKLLAVAAASAAASSMITYAVFRRYERLRRSTHACEDAVCHPEQLTPARVFKGLASSWSVASVERQQQTASDQRHDPFDPSPRHGYLSWDDYFMAVAFLSSQRSKDPAKQVGACIVDCNNVICGIGYNGFPRGCPDSKLPWAKRSRNGNPLETKYPYVCHAEMNAILNKNGASVAGARVYVTMFPCNECAKLLIQAGIAEIIFHEDKAQPRGGTPAAGGFKLAQQYAASKNLLQLAGVKVRQHRFSRPVELILGNDQADRPVVATRAAMDGSDDANRDATVRVATPATMGDPVNGGEYAVSPANAAEKVAPGSKKDEVNGKTLDFAEDSF